MFDRRFYCVLVFRCGLVLDPKDVLLYLCIYSLITFHFNGSRMLYYCNI